MWYYFNVSLKKKSELSQTTSTTSTTYSLMTVYSMNESLSSMLFMLSQITELIPLFQRYCEIYEWEKNQPTNTLSPAYDSFYVTVRLMNEIKSCNNNQSSSVLSLQQQYQHMSVFQDLPPCDLFKLYIRMFSYVEAYVDPEQCSQPYKLRELFDCIFNIVTIDKATMSKVVKKEDRLIHALSMNLPSNSSDQVTLADLLYEMMNTVHDQQDDDDPFEADDSESEDQVTIELFKQLPHVLSFTFSYNENIKLQCSDGFEDFMDLESDESSTTCATCVNIPMYLLIPNQYVDTGKIGDRFNKQLEDKRHCYELFAVLVTDNDDNTFVISEYDSRRKQWILYSNQSVTFISNETRDEILGRSSCELSSNNRVQIAMYRKVDSYIRYRQYLYNTTLCIVRASFCDIEICCDRE
jgi:hypothetical protein